MPTYAYRCNKCKKCKEVVHKMTDEPDVLCETCNEKMERVPISNIGGVQYNGEWFKTKGKY